MSHLAYMRHMAKIARAGVEARFSGVCRECPVPIKPGDRIVPAGGGGFVHLNCPTGDPE